MPTAAHACPQVHRLLTLTAVTKEVYLNVKHNLVCEWSELCPAHLTARIELPADHELVDKVRGILAIKLISLLRTQLKSDLTIYGPTYAGKLNSYERFFLEQSGVNLRSRAWAKASGYSWWGRLPLVRTVAGRLPRGKPQDFTEPGLPQPSPLLGRSAVLDVGEACRTPASSRIAMENALHSGSAGSAGVRGGIPEVHSDNRDASIGLKTLPQRRHEVRASAANRVILDRQALAPLSAAACRTGSVILAAKPVASHRAEGERRESWPGRSGCRRCPRSGFRAGDGHQPWVIQRSGTR